MRKYKKLCAAGLSVGLAAAQITAAGGTALAAGNQIEAQTQETEEAVLTGETDQTASTGETDQTASAEKADQTAARTTDGKEEVVYASADGSGAVEQIDVVNIFKGGDITDYGNYSSVKLLNDTADITQSGDEIRFTSDQDRVSYQGTMTDGELPWKIQIRYFIDGVEYSADEAAGKSGALELRFQVSENPACTGDFYDHYALQASFTLSTDCCENIEADGATIANVGSDKQITYTILPGKGIDTVIKADVTDFEMDAAAINGIALNLNVDVDEEKTELKDQVGELTDAAVKLDDGAKEVADGAKELADGTDSAADGADSLASGAGSLQNGISSLSSGISSVQSGVKKLQSGLDTLEAKSEDLTDGSSKVNQALSQIRAALSGISADSQALSQLAASSAQIKESLAALTAGAADLEVQIGYDNYKALMAQNGLDIDSLTAGNASAAASLSELAETLAQTPGMEAQAASLAQAAQLLTADNAAFAGMSQYLAGVKSGAGELQKNLQEMTEQYSQFDAAIGDLTTTLSGLLVQLSQLTSAINTLTDQYQTMDQGIREYTDGVALLTSGAGDLTNGVAALASGSKELLSGADELTDGAASLSDGMSALKDGSNELADGSGELADGTGELRSETDGMDQKIDDKINDLIASIDGGDFTPESFVSAKNTNVSAVQFVIKTAAVEKEEDPEPEVEEEKKESFLDKLLGLF